MASSEKDKETDASSSAHSADDSVWFGNARVPADEKAGKVADIFDRVAPHYDCMNDLLSFGIHRGWKSLFLDQLPLFPGDKVLDLASGTGDLCPGILKRIGNAGTLFATDINPRMLEHARQQALAKGWFRHNVNFGLVDAENIPYDDESIDLATISFGLRNTTNMPRVMQEVKRVLSTHGMLAILEFSTPVAPWFQPVYEAYSRHFIPKVGSKIGRSRAAYQYLVESIARHPDRFQLATMLEDQGFYKVQALPLSGGIAAIHLAVKPPLPTPKREPN